MKNRFQILTSPLFLIGLVLLLLNDFYLKAEFGNGFTGKLSDFSGLFIFPLFLTVLFPRRVIACFVLTGVFFVFWKLPVSDGLVQWVNQMHIPVGRTVDSTDLIALIVLPMAYFYQKSPYRSLKINPQILAMISVFAFCATTLPPREEKIYVNVNQRYDFHFSRETLVNKLNEITVKKVRKFSKYQEICFQSEGDVFYSSLIGRNDTIAVLLDSKQISGNDTIHYHTHLADFLIQGNDSSSNITFINAYKLVPVFPDKDYREKAIKEFEKQIIRKLK
ncbi:MAG: hypothetical protein KDD63_15970 [Bacteroidetes bacterium]|nr:hypothetical protein [Bacteroidota bacterium]